MLRITSRVGTCLSATTRECVNKQEAAGRTHHDPDAISVLGFKSSAVFDRACNLPAALEVDWTGRVLAPAISKVLGLKYVLECPEVW